MRDFKSYLFAGGRSAPGSGHGGLQDRQGARDLLQRLPALALQHVPGKLALTLKTNFKNPNNAQNFIDVLYFKKLEKQTQYPKSLALI